MPQKPESLLVRRFAKIFTKKLTKPLRGSIRPYFLLHLTFPSETSENDNDFAFSSGKLEAGNKCKSSHYERLTYLLRTHAYGLSPVLPTTSITKEEKLKQADKRKKRASNRDFTSIGTKLGIWQQ